MSILAPAIGSWSGTNGFRLKPRGRFVQTAAEARIVAKGGGLMTFLAYTWEHPADGGQEGLLLFGRAGDGELVAVWTDTWHQQPTCLLLSGHEISDSKVEVDGEYVSGWRWQISVDADEPGRVRVQMAHVIPAEAADEKTPAGPHPVMVMILTAVG